MKTLKLSTGLIPFLDVSTYHGCCDPDHVIHLDHELKDSLVEKYWQLFEGDKYENMLLENARLVMENNVLEWLKSLKLGVTDLKVTEFWSPREYNFNTDQVYFDLELDHQINGNNPIAKYIRRNANNPYFVEFLKENYSSYDGFMSLTPSNPGRLLENLKEDPERCVSAVISYLLSQHEDAKKWQYEFEELINENSWYNEFLPDNEEAERFLHKCNVNLAIQGVI